MRVLHSDHRRLLIKVDAPHLVMNIVVAHALDHTYSEHDRGKW